MNLATDTLHQLEPLLGWLQAEPDADPGRELLAAQEQCAVLLDIRVKAERRRELLDLFYGRAFDLAGRFRVTLMEAALPLPRELHMPVRRLVQLCVDLGRAYLAVARELSGDLTRSRGLGDGSLGAHALDLLSEAWVVGAMSGMAARFELWSTAHSLFLALTSLGLEGDMPGMGPDSKTTRAYKRLLALAVIQPEACSPREIGWVADFLDEQAEVAELGPLETGCSSGYWIDPAQDAPPVAVARRPPPTVDGLFHLASDPLARLVTQRIERLTRGPEERLDDPLQAVAAVTGEADLPEGLAARELVALLRRLREHWAQPPLRETPRTRRHYTVEVCLGLRAIWDMGQYGEAKGGIEQWFVLNESPGGYAVMSVAGADSTLSAGMALALRRPGEPNWSICVVRWIRSEDPSQVEVGLKVVATASATPVRVGFRGGPVREMVHALLLPPTNEPRRHQAILAPAGTYSSRRFIFVHEGQRLYVAQGRLLTLDFQTASVELFQFEVDPYPL